MMTVNIRACLFTDFLINSQDSGGKVLAMAAKTLHIAPPSSPADSTQPCEFAADKINEINLKSLLGPVARKADTLLVALVAYDAQTATNGKIINNIC